MRPLRLPCKPGPYLWWIMNPLSIHKEFVLVFSLWKIQDGNKVIMTREENRRSNSSSSLKKTEWRKGQWWHHPMTFYIPKLPQPLCPPRPHAKYKCTLLFCITQDRSLSTSPNDFILNRSLWGRSGGCFILVNCFVPAEQISRGWGDGLSQEECSLWVWGPKFESLVSTSKVGHDYRCLNLQHWGAETSRPGENCWPVQLAEMEKF